MPYVGIFLSSCVPCSFDVLSYCIAVLLVSFCCFFDQLQPQPFLILHPCGQDYGMNESVTPESFLLGPGHATVLTYMGAINNMVFACLRTQNPTKRGYCSEENRFRFTQTTSLGFEFPGTTISSTCLN